MSHWCPHSVVDYHYATWHKCRACGALLHRIDVANGQPVLVERSNLLQPFTLMEFPSRPHARGGGLDYE